LIQINEIQLIVIVKPVKRWPPPGQKEVGFSEALEIASKFDPIFDRFGITVQTGGGVVVVGPTHWGILENDIKSLKIGL
jgi:hypothetical protein